MVRTKEQVLATKHKQDESKKVNPAPEIGHSNNNQHSNAEFYAMNVPTSPLPNVKMTERKNSAYPHYHYTKSPTMPTSILDRNNAPFFEPPYVMNNFWPPPPPPTPIPTSSNKSSTSNGKKLENMFSNLNAQEIHEMMMDCQYNEDEAILRLITQTGYLEYIRHRIYINNNSKNFPPTPRNNYIALPPLNHVLRETSNNHFSHQQPQHHPQVLVQPIPYNHAVASLPVPQQQSKSRTPLPIQQAPTKMVGNKLIIRLPPPLQQSKPLLVPAARENISAAAAGKEDKVVVPTELPKPLLPPPSAAAPSSANANSTTTTPDPQKQQRKTHKKHTRNSSTATSSTTTSNNGHHTSGGRLTLDDALHQIQNSNEDGYAGWSAARLRAYKMIDKNPNSYYYRFNAPGEQQKKGKWTDEENALFLNRLKQVGPNSQWGIFSIAIPGRVGYQCSNYYRFMIETCQLQDPNYVLDEKGKARYLFDKKTEDGAVEKIFRKHSKHGSISASELNKATAAAVAGGSNTNRTKKRKHKRKDDSDEDDDDPTFDIKKKYSSPSKKKPTAAKQYQSANSYNNGGGRMTRQRLLQQQQQNTKSDIDNAQKDLSDYVVPDK